jgi:RNA 2',3'-cyclic 3'-phosphodiesterase
LRLFVAVFPPLGLREALVRAARGLPVAGDVRWIRPENVHITLKFLGEVAQENFSRVAHALEPVRERHEPFEVAPEGFGAFPSPRRAQVLWAGVGEGADRLSALARDVEASLEPLGFDREPRRFIPHLTLGRARRRPAALGAGTARIGGNFSVRRMHLVQSALGAQGASYTTLAAYALSGELSEGSDQGPYPHDDKQ